jgi:hypothetical protein
MVPSLDTAKKPARILKFSETLCVRFAEMTPWQMLAPMMPGASPVRRRQNATSYSALV